MMTRQKSIDGLPPRREGARSAVGADGFVPVRKGRKPARKSGATGRAASGATKKTAGKTVGGATGEMTRRTASGAKRASGATVETIRPEDFVPVRKSMRETKRELPRVGEEAGGRKPRKMSEMTLGRELEEYSETRREGEKYGEAERGEYDEMVLEDEEDEAEDEGIEEIDEKTSNEEFLGPIEAFDPDGEMEEADEDDEEDEDELDEEDEEDEEELMEEDEEEEKRRRKGKKAARAAEPVKAKKKKWSGARKFWTWTAVVILVVLIGGGTWVVNWGNSLLGKLTGDRGNLIDLVVESYEPLKSDEGGRTNVLVFGTSGFDMAGTEAEGVIHDGAALTDSIMVISFDQATGDAILMSVPRDLKVDTGCNYTGKINEVYTCHDPEGTDEDAGANALMASVGGALGIDLDYYAHINWGSLEAIIDALGGITVTLDEPVHDYLYTKISYEAGVPYQLSGADAVNLARARHGTENGDFTRGASQQKIILGIKDKILEGGLSVADILNLATTLGDNLRTNFSVAEMRSLAHLATTIDWNNITQVSFLEPEPLLTAGTIGGISYVFPTAGVDDYTEIQDYLHELMTSTPEMRAIAGEAASVLVLNATETAGLAGGEQTALEGLGLTDVAVDNLEGEYADAYTLYAFTTEKPATKAALEGHYGVSAVEATAEAPAPVEIPLGYDFVLVLGGETGSEGAE